MRRCGSQTQTLILLCTGGETHQGTCD